MEDEIKRDAWTAIAKQVLETADTDGKDLQFEFGKEHVSFIVGCNQFLRIYKSGEHAGSGEILPEGTLDIAHGDAVGGMVFKMFGWRHVQVQEGLREAVLAAYDAAKAKAAPSL